MSRPITHLTQMKDATIKQRRWLHEYIKNGGNATEAAMKAYDVIDRGSAATVGWDCLRKLDITEALEEAGISTAKLLKVHKEGLNAMRVRAEQRYNSKTDGKFQWKYVEEPDHQTRHKFLETAYKLKRILIERDDNSIGQPAITIVIGNGFVPAGVVVDATPEAGTAGGQPSIQSAGLAPESPQNNNGNL